MAAAVSFAIVSCITLKPPPGALAIRSQSDSATIERGRYLVYGPAHCVSCHGNPARDSEMRAGKEVALSGGRVFDLGPLGAVAAPNITSDPDTGIGAMSDATLVHALRYGTSRHGKPLLPFMSSFKDLSDDDLTAVVSFLRTLPPVRHEPPRAKLTWLGTFGRNFVLRPYAPASPPPTSCVPSHTTAYGRYLAHTVANCHGCHTLRSRWTGAFIGPEFAGGMQIKERTGTFITPNLTPIPSGILSALTEQEFIARFRIPNRALSGSPMPWEAYERMTDKELGAIYRYLKTVPAAETP